MIYDRKNKNDIKNEKGNKGLFTERQKNEIKIIVESYINSKETQIYYFLNQNYYYNNYINSINYTKPKENVSKNKKKTSNDNIKYYHFYKWS